MKKVLAFVLCLTLLLICVPMSAYADSETVVTIGADLTEEQKEKMFTYFGVDKNKVSVIEVTNAEERQYLEGVATEAQIGRRTLSCAYIQETEDGNGINVKIANLNMVTSSMIATTLSTAGIYNCNVVAACPIEVSGTGALTGIMKAFEKVTGEKLDEEKKELATEELITTAELADNLNSNDKATGIITAAKEAVIKSGTDDEKEIEKIIKDTAKAYGVDLTADQLKMIKDILLKVAKQDYDYDKLKSTLSGISETAANKLNIDIDFSDIGKEEASGFLGAVSNFFEAIADFFKGIGSWFSGLFGGDKKINSVEQPNGDNKDLGILNNTDESVLGDDVITNSTDEKEASSDNSLSSKDTTKSSEEPKATQEAVETQENSQSDTTQQDNSSTDTQEDTSASTNTTQN